MCQVQRCGTFSNPRFFPQGEQRIGGADAGNYFYTRDHLGSVRELVDATGAVRARYTYTVWGARTKQDGGLDTEIGFTGYWHHAASGLLASPTRLYSAVLGRFPSRDPIKEAGGLNLYAYVQSDPTNSVDVTGETRIRDIFLSLYALLAFSNSAGDKSFEAKVPRTPTSQREEMSMKEEEIRRYRSGARKSKGSAKCSIIGALLEVLPGTLEEIDAAQELMERNPKMGFWQAFGTVGRVGPAAVYGTGIPDV